MKVFKNKAKRNLFVIFIILIIFALDQWTKNLAEIHLAGSALQEYLGGLFNLVFARNPGAFLSLGSQLQDDLRFWIFGVLITVVLSFIFIDMLRKQKPTFEMLGLTFMIGGGYSNLFDRLFREKGLVVDFMLLKLGPLKTGIFNIADVCIMIGLGLLILQFIIEKKQKT